MTEDTRRIVEEILAIPGGRVSSYRDLAIRAGIRNGARRVVWALHSLSEKCGLPWHRVIRADGFIALGGGADGGAQAELLRKEGVEVSAGGRVDLEKYGFHGQAACGK